MTHVDLDPAAKERAFLAAIVAQPDEDMPRLAYAEWLDEQPTRWVKWNCKTQCGVRHADCCELAGGTGSVVDRSDADRAEFIRVQCELARVTPDTLEAARMMSHESRIEAPPTSVLALVRRCDELLEAHSASWSAAPCPECAGKGGRFAKVDGGYGTEWVDCSTCGGSCDLLKKPRRDGDTIVCEHCSTPQPANWNGAPRRGVSGVNCYRCGKDVGHASRILGWSCGWPVVGASLREWGEECSRCVERTRTGQLEWGPCPQCKTGKNGSPGWQPTPLARLIARLPGVAGLWVTDREAYKLETTNDYSWWRAGQSMSNNPRSDAGTIPEPVFDLMWSDCPEAQHQDAIGKWLVFSTPELADAALGRAVWTLTTQKSASVST